MGEATAHKFVWWGWGLLDALFMVNYVLRSLLAQRVPFYSDALSAIELIDDHGSYAIFLVALGWGSSCPLSPAVFYCCVEMSGRGGWSGRSCRSDCSCSRPRLLSCSYTVVFTPPPAR